MSTTTTQMGLKVPQVNDPSPGYVNDYATSLTLLDAHDHTSGKGAPITQSAISLTGALPMANQTVANARSVQLAAQSPALISPSDNNSIFSYNNDLWFLNGANQLVRVTTGQALSGGIGGDYTTYTNAQINYINSALAYDFRDSASNLAKGNFGSLTVNGAVATFVSGTGYTLKDGSNSLAQLNVGATMTLAQAILNYDTPSLSYNFKDATGTLAKGNFGSVVTSGTGSFVGGITQGNRIIALRGLIPSNTLVTNGTYPITQYVPGTSPAFVQTTFVPPFAGSIAAMTARVYGATSTGTLTLATSGLTTNPTSPAVNGSSFTAGYYITYPAGTYTFAANTAITVNVTSNTWTQSTTAQTGVEVYLWVYC